MLALHSFYGVKKEVQCWSVVAFRSSFRTGDGQAAQFRTKKEKIDGCLENPDRTSR
jgi:hypothetical protein